MNKQGKRIIVVLIMLICLSGTFAQADSMIQPRADSEFHSAVANLMDNKKVVYTAMTYELKEKIFVKACWLQKKVDGKWTFNCSLAVPDKTATNAYDYASMMDYSSDIGSGTFRIAAVFHCDGHSITRYSNERTF